MSTISPKEQNMLLVTVVIVLYAFAAFSVKKQLANWKASERVYVTAQKKLQEEKSLIAARDEWAARYDEVRELMPVFPREKDVDTHWLNVMDTAASTNGLTIARRQTNKEAEVGDVFELPIDCKDWEGSLESLVKFLYALNQEGAMLDVRQLYVRPSNKPGYLKGSFTLYCAYMRGKVEKLAAPAKPAAAGTPEAVTEAPKTEGSPQAAPALSAEGPAMDGGATNSPATEGGATNSPAEQPPAAAPEKGS